MVERKIKNFDLKQICESGQIFRMYERTPGIFDIYSADRYLRIEQGKQSESDKTVFYCSEDEFNEYWFHYFDLDRDYSLLVSKAMASDDLFLQNACRFGCGIRVLHQNIWEMMISFIISQQKQIPSIRKCIEALCKRFGEKKSTGVELGKYGADSYFTFPTAEKIVAAGPDGLKGLSLGYRERYIYETAVKYLENGIRDEVVEAMSYMDAKQYFLSYTGIGEKVANCILLFGAGFVDAFPIDTHIKDILYREYYLNRSETSDDNDAGMQSKKAVNCLSISQYEEIIDRNFRAYTGSRGIVQQWIFAYELNKKH